MSTNKTPKHTPDTSKQKVSPMTSTPIKSGNINAVMTNRGQYHGGTFERSHFGNGKEISS